MVSTENIPLAERLRPMIWADYQNGQQIEARLLRRWQAGQGRPPSLIIWGPPGCGKTTLAKLIGQSYQANFVEFSAVLSGVKDIREVVDQAKKITQPTILFIDEIHRFNKAQQDAFLPHVEGGVLSLIGATTENPSFTLTGALLSRCQVLTLKVHSNEILTKILIKATSQLSIELSPEAENLLIQASSGDARQLLNLLESLSQSVPDLPMYDGIKVREFLQNIGAYSYDRDGEDHYNMISAFIKSLRGSDPDAALFWGFRMLESGEEARFIIRRMILFAAEDVSNADPRALQIAVATSDAFERVGLPEGYIPIAQCITYLATAPKSNRSYLAMHKVLDLIKKHPKVTVPLHIRNAPTGLMKSLGYGANYQYPHDSQDGFVPGVRYLPEEVQESGFYQPTERGYEKTIKERLEWLKNFEKKSG